MNSLTTIASVIALFFLFSTAFAMALGTYLNERQHGYRLPYEESE